MLLLAHLQFGARGERLLRIVPTGRFPNNPDCNHADWAGQSQWERLARREVLPIGRGRGGIIAERADGLPFAVVVALDFHSRLARAGVEPTSIVKTLAVGEEHAADGHRGGKR